MSKDLPENLCKLIETGRKERAAKLEAEKMELDAIDKHEREQDARELQLALQLLPEEVRPFATLENHNELRISIPGLAIVTRPVYVSFDFINGNRKNIRSVNWWTGFLGEPNLFRVWVYKANKGDISLIPLEPEYKDLGEVLAVAAEIGDGKLEAEALAEKQRAEAEQPKVKTVDIGEVKLCPILVRAGGHITDCQGELCALWNGEQCSIRALAYYAANRYD